MTDTKRPLKYIIKTNDDKTYSLYIMEAEEFQRGRYIAIFLYYDEDSELNSPEKLWLRVKHRILYENSIDAIKEKIIELGSGRNEKFIFLEVQE